MQTNIVPENSPFDLECVKQVNNYINRKQTGALTKFLINTKAWFQHKSPELRQRVLQSFLNEAWMTASGTKVEETVTVTNVERLMRLVRNGVFTPLEVKPLILKQIFDPKLLFIFASKYPDIFTEDEIREKLSVERLLDVKKYDSVTENGARRARRAIRAAEKIPGVREQLIVAEVMKE